MEVGSKYTVSFIDKPVLAFLLATVVLVAAVVILDDMTFGLIVCSVCSAS